MGWDGKAAKTQTEELLVSIAFCLNWTRVTSEAHFRFCNRPLPVGRIFETATGIGAAVICHCFRTAAGGTPIEVRNVRTEELALPTMALGKKLLRKAASPLMH